MLICNTINYPIIRNPTYDFAGQSYATLYPNLHKYPATMLPQIGIEILKELNISKGRMLDPYCGSGSSFVAAIHSGLRYLRGYDINPLAALIAEAKFTNVEIDELESAKNKLKHHVSAFIKDKSNIESIELPTYHNLNYWFSMDTARYLCVLRKFVNEIEPKSIRRFFWVALSETIRECSYTRSSEFKLFRIKPQYIIGFNPEVVSLFFSKLSRNIDIFQYCYKPLLNGINVCIEAKEFNSISDYFDVVLTSPPYGDSRTTVAYGQFSLFANEWMEIESPRKLDANMFGGKASKILYTNGLIYDYIKRIDLESSKRAKEISSYYFDMEKSISKVAKSVRSGGFVVYIVGNRIVKGIQLPTDQFIAEKFEENGFEHIFTYERFIGNKHMPLQNSPSNQIGKRANTMSREYIIVCKNINRVPIT